MSKLKEAIEEKDWLKAKRLIIDNPEFLEENVDLILGMVKDPLSPGKTAELFSLYNKLKSLLIQVKMGHHNSEKQLLNP